MRIKLSVAKLFIFILFIFVAGCNLDFLGETDNNENEGETTNEAVENEQENTANSEATEEENIEDESDAVDATADDQDESEGQNGDQPDPTSVGDLIARAYETIEEAGISELNDGRDYTFTWNYNVYELNDFACELSADKLVYTAENDELQFKALFDVLDSGEVKYPEDGLTIIDKNTSTTYVTYEEEFDIDIYAEGDMIAGVSIMHEQGNRESLGQPLGFILNCGDMSIEQTLGY